MAPGAARMRHPTARAASNAGPVGLEALSSHLLFPSTISSALVPTLQSARSPAGGAAPRPAIRHIVRTYMARFRRAARARMHPDVA